MPGLINFFEQGLSPEAGRCYKPGPATYHYACKRLGVVPADTGLRAYLYCIRAGGDS